MFRMRALVLVCCVLYGRGDGSSGGPAEDVAADAFMSTAVDFDGGVDTCDDFCASLSAECVDGLTEFEVPATNARDSTKAGFGTTPRSWAVA